MSENLLFKLATAPWGLASRSRVLREGFPIKTLLDKSEQINCKSLTLREWKT